MVAEWGCLNSYCKKSFLGRVALLQTAESDWDCKQLMSSSYSVMLWAGQDDLVDRTQDWKLVALNYILLWTHTLDEILLCSQGPRRSLRKSITKRGIFIIDQNFACLVHSSFSHPLLQKCILKLSGT